MDTQDLELGKRPSLLKLGSRGARTDGPRLAATVDGQLNHLSIKAQLAGRSAHVLIDSGATGNFIDLRFAEATGIAL